MARTAPAPNLIAIPGMNPGTIVAGGGGGGGGGSGKGGKGGKGGNGGNGGGDGEDAEGGTKNAVDCGTGAPGGCTNCGSSISRGDPVDVATGELFTIPHLELKLPGTFDLEVYRNYSSQFRSWDVGFGPGWGHSLAWELRVGRRHITIRNGSRTEESFPILREEGEQASAGGWALLRMSDGFILRPGNEFQHYFVRSVHDPTLYQLRAVSFRSRGMIRLQYEGAQLKRVTDTVGRVIEFDWEQGRIVALSTANTSGRHFFARYEYDSERRLSAAIDANGEATSYYYDEQSRLTQLRYPTGLRFHYRYDGQNRCIETWGDYESGSDPALDESAPEKLADNDTKAKGIYHFVLNIYDESFREGIDSARIQRYSAAGDGTLSQAFDGAGGQTEYIQDRKGRTVERIDSLGGSWKYQYDHLDKIIREEDPEQRVRIIQRDHEGRPLVLVEGEGGATQLTRRPDGEVIGATDPLGNTWAFGVDERGQLMESIDPLGARTIYERDAHGNISYEQEPNGRALRYEYDFLGHCIAKADSEGRVTRYLYDNIGQLTSVMDPLGRQSFLSYDGLGNRTAVTNAAGFTTRYEWGGFRWLCKQTNPQGTELNLRYNREGWLVRVINEAGEEHTQAHDSEGQIKEELSFDGRRKRLTYDDRSFLASYEEGFHKTNFERNGVGQLTAVEAADGTTRRYEYNQRGQRTLFENKGAGSDGVQVHWGWDQAGKLVQERYEIEGRKYTVDSILDPLGRRLSTQSSLGYQLTTSRDGAGRVSALVVNGRRVLNLQRDALGDISTALLEGGGQVLQRHDAARRLAETTVLGPTASSTPSAEPERVGAQRGTLSKSYEYDARDELVARSTNSDRTEYAYNARRELVSVTRGFEEERYLVDAAGNYSSAEAGAGAVYEAGNRLVRQGQSQYGYDLFGRQDSKTQTLPDGTTRSWRYEWDDFGFLRAVETPDALRVEFLYDVYARRVSKKVLRHDTQGDITLSHTHYIWDRVALLQEVDVLGPEPEVTRSYAYLEQGDEVSVGHLDEATGRWVYYHADHNGTPEELLDPQGNVVGRLARETFGKVSAASGETTAIRFPGQYADEETGLHYNRYRYYDPEAGRYISPDPINLSGGPNLYAYGPNPIGWFDPMGWEHGMLVTGVEGLDESVAGELRGTLFSSGMGEDCPPHLRSQARCHTERKFADRIREIAGGGRFKKGTRFHLKGALPPCPNCHRAMQKLADDCGGEYTYEYGNGQTVTYSGGTNPQFSDANLEAAYRMTPTSRMPRGAANQPQHVQDSLAFGYSFDNWNNATAGYSTAKGG